MLRRHRFVSTSIVMLLSATALAQVDPNSGIDFVTIGAAGNAPYAGRPGGADGRGQVNYEYRMGRFEVTTSQWVEFMNAAFDRPASDAIPHVYPPSAWGGAGAPAQNGGRRWRVQSGMDMIPTSGVDWRTCAIYCNWLHNGKSLERSAFLSGAYEVSTFGYIGSGGGFTDQLTRSPGARYWVPNLDEWVKAAHYDPAKPNANGTLGGYWTYGNSSDVPFVAGPPGVLVNGQLATANTGWSSFSFPGYSPFSVPLGAYTGVTSPWGLYDVAGGTSEWLEDYLQDPSEPVPRYRYWEGSSRFFASHRGDEVGEIDGGEFPTYFGDEVGFRVAASVPAPGALPGLLILGSWTLARSRRRPPPTDRKPTAARPPA
jgi:formylglycine-generating enzyme required for sulfatase activity